MLFLKVFIFGLLACFVGAIHIDVTINGAQVKSIPAGSDVVLNCSVPRDDAVDRFDWLKGNQSVSDHVVTTSFQGGVWWSSLVLQNVSPINTTAMYTCRTWKNNSTKSTLQRHVCVDEIVLQVEPRALMLDAGDSSVITCTVQASCEVPSLQWLKLPGNIITDKHRIVNTSKTELKLKLSEVNLKDRGLYYCRAINSAGREVKTQMFLLIVNEVLLPNPPLVTSPHQHVDGYHGSDVTLSFSTQYTPRPLSYGEWYYDGKVLHDSPKYTIHNRWFFPGTDRGLFSMTVHNLNEDDSGNYTLEVTTSVKPFAVGHVQLTVHGRDPNETHGMVPNVPTVKAKEIEISCEMEYPNSEKQPPRLYWALNGEKLTPQSKYKTRSLQEHKGHHNTLIKMVVTIFNYSQSDCRWYTCGMNTSQGVKEKLVAPCPMNQIESQATSEQEICCKWMWIPITLAGVFMLVAMVIGLTCLFVKHEKIKNNIFHKGFVRHSGEEGHEKYHVHSNETVHNELHSNL
ncbi:hemicentin-2-like isoform X1 [Actinia tenebrosa]|uniref:Hemicentin-2-like isoform X1 n=1 Tax=Actinia tenebrosa TaxID=6105 RepID=A0A6P8IG35_ACTTE|nr:hemicentin-2-like isoform X1 [Actinia tenebrosa]